MQARLGRLSALIPLVLVMAIVGATTTAGAQGTAPAACLGNLYTDAKGDATYLDANADAESPANPNEDIRAFFFNHAPGADGKPVLTANIVVENLDKTATKAKYGTASAWEVRMTGASGESYTARALLSSGTWSYKLTYFERPAPNPTPVNPGVLKDDVLKGQTFEGPMGVISMEVPATLADFKLGAKLTAVNVTVIPRSDTRQGGFFTDRAPDASASDKAYTIVECPAAAAAETTPTPEATPEAPTPAQQQQQGQGEGQQQQQGQQPPAQQQGGGATPAQPKQPARTSRPAAKKPKKCKKGFKRKTVRKKSVCVKVKKKKATKKRR